MRRSMIGLAFGLLRRFPDSASTSFRLIPASFKWWKAGHILTIKPLEGKFGQFPDIKENQELRTEEGRAEIFVNSWRVPAHRREQLHQDAIHASQRYSR